MEFERVCCVFGLGQSGVRTRRSFTR